mgnify:FL=1
MQQTQNIDIDWVRLKVHLLMTSSDVRNMDATEFGAYMFLLLNSFYNKKRGFLKNDDKYLMKTAKLTPKQWSKSKELILSKFNVDTDGDLYNERWLSEIRDAEQSILSNKNRTAVARQARTGKSDTIPANTTKHTDTQIITSGWRTIEQYIAYREYEFNNMDENFRNALNEKIGITRPYCWCNKKFPQGYFDLVECIIKVREDVEWRTTIMRNHNMSKEMLLSNVYEFVKQIKDSTVYKTYDGYDGADGKDSFIHHFTSWLNKKNK